MSDLPNLGTGAAKQRLMREKKLILSWVVYLGRDCGIEREVGEWPNGGKWGHRKFSKSLMTVVQGYLLGSPGLELCKGNYGNELRYLL